MLHQKQLKFLQLVKYNNDLQIFQERLIWPPQVLKTDTLFIDLFISLLNC